MINPILWQSQIAQLPSIYSDFKSVSSVVNNSDSPDNSVFAEAMPIYGKINSLPEKLDKKDYIPATGIATLAILNGPEEMNDIMSAYKQIKNGFPKPVSYHSGYDNKIAQHPFSFFRGTILHKYLNPLSEDCPDKEGASWLIAQDRCLLDTKFGKWVQRKLGIEYNNIRTDIENIKSLPEQRKYIPAKVFKTSNPIKDLIARTLTRTSKIGTLVLGGIEAAHVAHETANGNNPFVEAGKSAATLGVTLTATGALGAIGAKHLGPTGSLIGIGTGTILGALTNKALN